MIVGWGYSAARSLASALDADSQVEVTLIGKSEHAPDLVIMGSHDIALDVVVGALAERGRQKGQIYSSRSISPLISSERPISPSVTVASAGSLSLPLSLPSAKPFVLPSRSHAARSHPVS